MPELRRAHRPEDAGATPTAKDTDITARSKAPLDGAAERSAVLSRHGRFT